MKKILFLLAALTVLITTGCQRDPSGAERGRTGKLRLNVEVDKLLFDGGGNPTRSADATRAVVEAQTGEDQIESLFLLFFEADASGQGRFVDHVEVDLGTDPASMDVHTRMADIDLAGTTIDPAAAYNILAVANVGDTQFLDDGQTLSGWLGSFSGMTEEEAIFNARGRISTKQRIEPDGLLMNGRIEKAAAQTQLNLTLSRNNSRLDVVNNTREAYDLVSATIWNAYPSTSIWPGDVMMDYSPSVERVRKFYGIDNTANTSTVAGADGQGNLINDIRGGLYVFENQVITPDKNDNVTTCLIIGLTRRGETKPTYYRANVVLDGKSQYLRRNYAYALTIRSVSGPGAATEELAYLGEGNTLEYTIGWWNIDDNGLIVKDDNSILSLPTKVVNIGRDASTSNYSIYTFSSLTSPAPLSIRSQIYSPVDDGIKARLDGNTLVIEAQPLDYDQTERRGVIILAFAGLETSLTVVQSGAADDYLRVILPEGGIPRFQPFAGIPSGLIHVEASGPWTAQIFLDGFTFSSIPSNNPITVLPSTSGLVVENRFRVYTNANNDSGHTRDAFIVVSLDKDAENYQSLIRISQASLGSIKLDPNDQTMITFDGLGQLAVIPGTSNVNEFKVITDKNDDGTFKYWNAELIAQGAHSDPDYFNVHIDYDQYDPDKNTVSVTAVGINTFGRTLSAVLRIYTDPATYTDITVFQQPVNINLIPSTVGAIPTVGGQSVPIRIDGPQSLTWRAAIKPVAASAPDNRQLVHHEATLVDQSGNPLSQGTEYPMATQFRVVFPKVFYPNRDIPIAVDVEVTVAGVTQTIRVNQTALTARPMVGFCMGNTGTSYGQFGSIYNAGWEGRTNGGYVGGTYGLMQIPNYSFASPESGPIEGTSIPGNITYLHVTPGDGQTTNFNWTTINNYIDTRDAWTMFQPQSPTSYPSFNGASSPTKRNGAGYQDMRYQLPTGSTGGGVISTRDRDTKVYQFIMDRGNQPLTPSDITENFHVDAVYTLIPGPWPATAVVMMTPGSNSEYALLIIDVKNKFMYLGESQVFWGVRAPGSYNRLSANRGTFLDNLMYLVGNASKYGSHFTDLLLESDQQGSQPAPWDDYWGDNRGGRPGGNGVGSK